MRIAAAFAAADRTNEFLLLDDEGTPFHCPARNQYPQGPCNLGKRAELGRQQRDFEKPVQNRAAAITNALAARAGARWSSARHREALRVSLAFATLARPDGVGGRERPKNRPVLSPRLANARRMRLRVSLASAARAGRDRGLYDRCSHWTVHASIAFQVGRGWAALERAPRGAFRRRHRTARGTDQDAGAFSRGRHRASVCSRVGRGGGSVCAPVRRRGAAAQSAGAAVLGRHAPGTVIIRSGQVILRPGQLRRRGSTIVRLTLQPDLRTVGRKTQSPSAESLVFSTAEPGT